MNKPGNRRIELLAPAGDEEKLRLAIQYGADAVYLAARSFSLRAASANFSIQGLKDAIHYAHQRNVRVYLALNILAHQSDMEHLQVQIESLLETGPDAVIVADPGVFQLVKQQHPQMKIHISTQASTTNAQACRFWYEQGARRIILARELTLQEIKAIRYEIPEDLELEVFGHGAMCMAYSGRCLLSAYLTGRDANRGRCAQPCRWSFELTESGHPDKSLVMEEDERGTYFLNSRDICMIEHIPELAEAGVSSLKIEGRMKSGYYVSTVVQAYRSAIDRWTQNQQAYSCDPEWMGDLKKTTHRPFSTGFFFQGPEDHANLSIDLIDEREATVAGQVLAWLSDKKLALVEQKNCIEAGDMLELVQPGKQNQCFVARTILDLALSPINRTPHPRMLYYLPFSCAVEPGAMIRRYEKNRQ